jgi:RNA-directed DNA polymerase
MDGIFGTYRCDSPPPTHLVVHCVTERQAHQVCQAIGRRFAAIGLQLHPDKTRIVYCKDDRRRLGYDQVTFTFCGYAFRPRQTFVQGNLERGFCRQWPRGS